LKKIICIVLCALFIVSCINQEEHQEHVDIEYTVSPKLNETTPFLEVKFDYKSDKNGVITLRYENNSWGDRNIFNCIKKLEVFPKAESIDFVENSSKIIIRTTPNIRHKIRYQIKQDYKGLPLNEKRYRPIIDSSYFHVLGMRLFMVPERVFPSDSIKAKIKINFLPKYTKGIFHSSFGENYNQTVDVVREDLYASFFIGGDFRRYTFTLEGDTVNFLTRGIWKSFTDQDIFQLLKETITSQNKFWNDPRSSDFSVSLLPTYENWYSVGGSGFSTSFISFASNNEKVTFNHMRWLYNHELLHKWIGRTILNENEVKQYWFSEGFTDYYSYKLQLKNNYLSIEEYITILNKEVIIPHYQDPVKNTPNSQLTFQKYWSNYAKYQKLPYRRGLLYAFLIDNQIKKASNYTKSLDSVMHDILALALKDKKFRFNQSVFLDRLEKYLNPSIIRIEFDKYINKGVLIDFKNYLPEGLLIEYKGDVPLFRIDPTSSRELEKKLKL
jgi:predicted metalloprotease with PDZ domain